MLTILLLAVAQLPAAMCGGDRVCLRANEFAARYSQWTRLVNASTPGTVDAREPRSWEQVERTFKRLKAARQR